MAIAACSPPTGTAPTHQKYGWSGGGFLPENHGTSGGISNSAGTNIVPKSDGTNIVASSLSDNGTTVSTAEPMSFGAIPTQTLINGPLWQSFSIPNTTYPWGEVNRFEITGATPSYPADLFVVVVRNSSNQIDASTHSQRSGGVAMETNVTGITGTFPVTVVGGECQATGGTVNNCFEALNGDVVIDQGNLTVSAGTGFVNGQFQTDGELVAAGTGTIGVFLDGAPTDNIQSNDATTRFNVNATGPADLEITGGKGGAFSVLDDGDMVINSTAFGSHLRVTPAGYTVTLTNATCSSTKCSDVAGVVTASSTSMTITFRNTYTGANDADCIIEPMDGTNTTIPTCTTSATAITCTTVINAAKYHYICVGLQ